MSGELKPGDVVSYRASQHHCREGMAIVQEDGRCLDTFWSTGGEHCLTAGERASAEVLFNLADFDELDRNRHAATNRGEWQTFHPDDRGRITSQHGLCSRWFIRRGAKPDLSTQISNAEQAVEEAESALRSAQGTLDWRRGELATLREKAGV